MVLGDLESWKIRVKKHWLAEFKAAAVALYRTRPGPA